MARRSHTAIIYVIHAADSTFGDLRPTSPWEDATVTFLDR